MKTYCRGVSKKLKIRLYKALLISLAIYGLGYVARSRDIINASNKLNFTNPRPRGRPLKRCWDGIRENSGVPLLTWKEGQQTERSKKLIVHVFCNYSWVNIGQVISGSFPASICGYYVKTSYNLGYMRS